MDIHNGLDVIDSRDVMGRIEALEGFDCLDEEETYELAILQELNDEGESLTREWIYGEALIRHTYWTDYVIELLEDIGEIPRDLPDYIVIDWDATAQNILVDYSELMFDGVPYYIRSC
jgi:hypothetical protein